MFEIHQRFEFYLLRFSLFNSYRPSFFAVAILIVLKYLSEQISFESLLYLCLTNTFMLKTEGGNKIESFQLKVLFLELNHRSVIKIYFPKMII
jgi:hypothetical protein